MKIIECKFDIHLFDLTRNSSVKNATIRPLVGIEPATLDSGAAL